MSIYKALVQAQSKVRSVGKDRENTFSKYRYTSAEAMIDAARKILTSCGLAFVETRTTFERCDFVPRGDKGGGLVGRVHIAYSLFHETGETLLCETTAPVVIEKGRPDDKAEAAARTYALAYALRGLLQIDRQGDPDGVGEEEEVDERNDAPEPAPRQQKTASTYDVARAKILFSGIDTLETVEAFELWASAAAEALAGCDNKTLTRAAELVFKHAQKLEHGDMERYVLLGKRIMAKITGKVES